MSHEASIQSLVPKNIVLVTENDGTPYDPTRPLKYWKDISLQVPVPAFVQYSTNLELSSNVFALGLTIPLNIDGHPSTPSLQFAVPGASAGVANVPPKPKFSVPTLPFVNTDQWPVPLRPLLETERVLQTPFGVKIIVSDPGDIDIPPVSPENQGSVLAEIQANVRKILGFLIK